LLYPLRRMGQNLPSGKGLYSFMDMYILQMKGVHEAVSRLIYVPSRFL